jgi:hypothetical protein
MKVFKIFMLLLLPFLGSSQNYITTAISYNRNDILVSQRYITATIINIYENAIYHNINGQIETYIIESKTIKKNNIIYNVIKNGIKYVITIKPNEIIFQKIFQNESISYYYETY